MHLVVPTHWHHEYSSEPVKAEFQPVLAGNARRIKILLAGSANRHVYRGLPRRVLSEVSPDAVFIEQEPFALVTGQWLPSIVRARVPFALQQDENLVRQLPWIARAIRRQSLVRASFVAARSPRAAEIVHAFAPELPAPVVPHCIMDWKPGTAVTRREGALRIGYAGRFVEEKGLRDLLLAFQRMRQPARLLCFGDGPLRVELERATTCSRPVEVITGIPHERMDRAYREMDVLVLPSRTTPTWAEQFGRVLVEAMSFGRPVIGSDSGEIPWVIGQTEGGRIFREGDVAALAACLDELASDPGLREALGTAGQRSVEAEFAPAAVADQTDHLLRTAIATHRSALAPP